MKKKKSPEEEEIEGSLAEEEECYEHVEDLLSLPWEWEEDTSNVELETSCEELLNRHREGLMENSFIAMDQDIPIVPPFANRCIENVENNENTDETGQEKPETSRIVTGKILFEFLKPNVFFSF